MTAPDTTTNAYGVPAALWSALEALVAADPDRAREKNDRGPNGSDSTPFHEIYQDGFARLTPPRAAWLHKALRKYAGQLQAQGISYADIALPAAYKMPASAQAGTSPAQGTAAPSAAPKVPRPPRAARVFLRDTEGDRCLCFESERDHPGTQIVRELPHRRWTGRDLEPNWCWRIALDARNLPGLRALYAQGIHFEPEAVAALKALSTGAGADPGLSKAAPASPAGIQIAPQVVPACRGLEASTRPLPGIAP